MIVLDLPDHSRLRLDDAEARSISERLWEIARQRGGTARLAVAIEAELRREKLFRQPIEVFPLAAERLTEVLAEPLS